ncbi:hypothetical protein [Homoserinibacter gongjuensis]|uniref:hypothetical protein n=1 Tax=Homoserinibacter gongjuensis TaxID=1162968 RepID=UPI0024E12364|nr:hypothetical protein [Homoserinibacter gongjuensis]
MTAVTSLSPQQLDPLGGVTAQAFGWALTAGAIGTSVGVSVVHRAEYRDGLFLAAGYVCLAVACLIVVLASSPRRAPFTWRSALAVHLVGLAAVGFEAAAQWGGNVTVRSDWSPLALALLVMAMACFRPAAELLGMAAGSAVVVAAITVAGSAAAGAPLPPSSTGSSPADRCSPPGSVRPPSRRPPCVGCCAGGSRRASCVERRWNASALGCAANCTMNDSRSWRVRWGRSCVACSTRESSPRTTPSGRARWVTPCDAHSSRRPTASGSATWSRNYTMPMGS